MQEIETPLAENKTPIGANFVCPHCHLMHIWGDCGYRESNKEDLVTDSVGPRGFKRRETYFGLGQEKIVCGERGLLLECRELLHQYFKRLYCGREWCLVCGEDDSNMHKRRYMRLMDKVFYLGDMGKGHGLGYFVFTIPSQIRDKFRNKTNLQRVGRFVRNLLKQHGFDIGLSRWHFFGSGEITEGELDLGVYHPHLNCLVVGRWIHDKEMRIIKEAWRKYLEILSGESIDVVDVWYNYYREKGEWWHKAVYVCRPTFKRLEGNELLVKALYDFRNLAYWGFGQGFEKEAKLKHGRVVLGLWLQGVKEDNGDGIDKKTYNELLTGSHMKCPKCVDEGRINVPIQMAMNLTTGGRVICERSSILLRIEKELGAGFYSLSNVIFNIKPMSSVEDDTESLENTYDTS